MVDDAETKKDEPSNQCCAALEKKCLKLNEECLKFKGLRKNFRNCIEVLGNENTRLKQALGESETQADKWKNEKEKESEVRSVLEDEVSKLKEEIRLLKHDGSSVSPEQCKLLQERLGAAEKEINRLKELLEKERGKAALEKKNAELERKKASDALKKVEVGKNKVSEAQKVANTERKRAEENRILWEKLKTELDSVKSIFASEISKSEAANNKFEAERQNADKERKRADLAVSEVEKLRRVIETNLKKVMIEKDNVNVLNKKLEYERNRADKMEAELSKHLKSRKPSEVCTGISIIPRNVDSESKTRLDVMQGDVSVSRCVGKMISDKEGNLIKENKLADLEKKKAKEQRKAAKKHKMMAKEEKRRADRLSKELENCKLKLEELKKGVQVIPYKRYADIPPRRIGDFVSETDTIKLLKKQLKLEKTHVKIAKRSAEVEAVRNNLLHKQLFYLKEECLLLQQRLNILDGRSSLAGEGTHLLEKIRNLTSTRNKICSNGHLTQSITGIDSRSDPPCGGSNQKMFKSAINSTSSSLSDRPLMGSQERGNICFATSIKPGEDISKLPDRARTSCCEHFALEDDNDDRSSIKGYANEREVSHHEKKQITYAVESVKKLDVEGKKLNQQVPEKQSVLQDILDNKKHVSADKGMLENRCEDHVRPSKRRKTFGDRTIQPLRDPWEPIRIPNSNIDHYRAIAGDSTGVFDVESSQYFDDGIDDLRNSRLSQNLDGEDFFDYMKLLELDDAADEEAYNRAIAMPLSPTLPEVEFHGDEKHGSGHNEMLDDRSLQEGVLAVTDNMGPSCSNMIRSEKDPGNITWSGPDALQLLDKDVTGDILMDMNCEKVDDAAICKNLVSGGNIGSLNMPCSENTELDGLCESRTASGPVCALKYLAVSLDNMDEQSISTIVRAVSSCKPQFSLLRSLNIFLQTFLTSLVKAENFSMKEKVCAFFSVILNEIYDVGMKNLAKKSNSNLFQSLDSFNLKIHSELSDMALQRMFLESFDLSELFSLIEDFLLQRKVFVWGDVDTDLPCPCSSKVNLVLDGNAIELSEVEASVYLSVAAGNLLASVCTTFGHIGFICEMSCNMFTMQKFDAETVLAVLHVFAHICGSQYLKHQHYALAMTLIRSLVVFLEKQTPSSKALHCGTHCPFSEGAISMEAVAILLVDELKKYVSLESSWNLLSHGALSTDEKIEDRLSSSVYYDVNFRSFVDILSLVELQASFMSWDWAFRHLVNQICEMCESLIMKDSSAAIIVLLGQLGRLGVAANGYKDSGVEKIRKHISALLCKNTSTKFPVQFSSTNALLGISAIRFEDIIEDKVDTSVIDQTIPVKFIRDWFFSLNHEQQSFFKLHQASSDGKS